MSVKKFYSGLHFLLPQKSAIQPVDAVAHHHIALRIIIAVEEGIVNGAIKAEILLAHRGGISLGEMEINQTHAMLFGIGGEIVQVIRRPLHVFGPAVVHLF